MKKIVICFLLIQIFNVRASDFTDHRFYNKEVSPEVMENALKGSVLSPGLLIKLVKGFPKLWEAEKVTDFFLYDGAITAILQDRIVYLEENECGGLLVDPDVNEIFLASSNLLASDGSTYHVYNIPMCAKINLIPRGGVYTSVSGGLICELGYEERLVRDLHTGFVLYRDNKPGLAVYAVENACYYLDGNGVIDVVKSDCDGEIYESIELMYLDEQIYQATAVYGVNGGFSGFIRDAFFNIKVLEGSLEINFEKIGKGVCLSSDKSPRPFCSGGYNDYILEEILKSSRFFIGDSVMGIMDGDRLTAYDIAEQWEKEAVFGYYTPHGCIKDGILYFTDPLGRGWSNESGTLMGSAIPEGCVFEEVQYSGGVFHAQDFIFRYAEPLSDSILKKEDPREILYFAR